MNRRDFFTKGAAAAFMGLSPIAIDGTNGSYRDLKASSEAEDALRLGKNSSLIEGSQKLGINNCFAVKRWPEPGAWIGHVRDTFGLRQVQFCFDLLDPALATAVLDNASGRILEATRKSQISLHSTFTGLGAYSSNMLMHPDLDMRLQALSWYENAIDLTAKLHAPATGGHFGALSLEDYGNTSRKEYLLGFLLDALCHLSSVAKRAGLERLLWEPMPLLREPPASIKEAMELYERANKAASLPIQFCLDLGHQCTRGVKKLDRDPYEWLRQIGSICPCIHLQQTDGLVDHHWPFTREYNEQGIIHPEKVMEALEKAGARDVMFVLEIIHPFEADEDKVLRDIRESVNYWKQYVSV